MEPERQAKYSKPPWVLKAIEGCETKEEQFATILERTNMDFLGTIELLIRIGWRRDDFKRAKIEQPFIGFSGNTVDENWARLDKMIEKYGSDA